MDFINNMESVFNRGTMIPHQRLYENTHNKICAHTFRAKMAHLNIYILPMFQSLGSFYCCVRSKAEFALINQREILSDLNKNVK